MTITGNAIERFIDDLSIFQKIARKRIVCFADIDEVLQNSALKIWRCNKVFESDSHRFNYQAMVVRRECYNLLQKRIIAAKTNAMDEMSDNLLARSTDVGTDRIDQRMHVDEVLATLPAKDRDICIMRIQGYSRAEIANRFSVTERAIGYRFLKIRLTLAALRVNQASA